MLLCSLLSRYVPKQTKMQHQLKDSKKIIQGIKKQHKSECLKLRTKMVELRKELEILKYPFINENQKDAVWNNIR